jgi:hypothetical protein
MSKLSDASKKSIKSYIGLFDVGFLSDYLKKKGYNFVNFNEKNATPNEKGAIPLSYFMTSAKKSILAEKYTKVTFHSNGKVSVKSKSGYFTFSQFDFSKLFKIK